MLFAVGDDDAGEAVLSSARRDAARAGDPHGMARIEIALASGAVVRDNDARAHGHLAAARRQVSPIPPSIRARAWLVEARLARVEGRPAPPAEHVDPEAMHEDFSDPNERLDLAAEMALEQAAVARLEGDLDGARAQLDRARDVVDAVGSPRLNALLEVEAGLYVAEMGDVASAYGRVRGAIEVLGDAGLRRDQGRTMIRLAEMMATHTFDDARESAALWLGRAQAALGPAATWRDRSSIRTGFRAHGRRLFDRVMTEGTATRIEAFERARGALLSALSLSVESTECALNDLEAQLARDPAADAIGALLERVRGAALSTSSGASPALGDLDKVVHDLIDLIGAALVERDRLRNLLSALSDIDAASDRDTLPPMVARLTARILEADHVVVALRRDGSLEPAGRYGEAPSASADLWRSAVAAVGRERTSPSDAPMSRRSDAQPAGPVLVVPMRASDVDGVIYADKLTRLGQFREQDHALAFLLAEYSAIALGRLRAREQERSALHRLAVTLDAIRDGVISCDEQGVIISTNAAFARFMRVGGDELVGARMDAIPALAPLWALLAVSQRVDGAVVKLTQGSFVVTTRPLLEEGSDEPGNGVVATLVELDRAQKLAQRIAATRPRYGFHDVVGTSEALRQALALAKQAAAIDANVLITGESGTGKEIIAQAIHTSGARANEPFVGINCAALPRDLLEAELFGYERGAFTGAKNEGNLGKFELAGQGTILLDEIGEMPLDMQAKLLRVLQERVITRLGGSVERAVHARVMATTHRNLQQLVDEGKFRMDLLFRLRVLAIELPSLRERPADIAMLAQHYLVRFAEQQRKRVRELGPAVRIELERYDWPGNVRELANVIEAEVSLLAADVTVLERLATRLVGRFRAMGAPSTGEARAAAPVIASDAPIVPLIELEKRAFLHALERSNQSVARASEALGVSKVTFYAKLRSWGLHPKDRGFDDECPTSIRRQRLDPFEPPTASRMRMPPRAGGSGSGPGGPGGGGASGGPEGDK
jgi:transcriptional regulator with PAS, ATPase and Fis domain